MEMQGGGANMTPMLSGDFCKYASVYREAMNTNSPFYRYLCLYKLMESIGARRSDAGKAARAAGQQPKSHHEHVPENREGLLKLLNLVYPWRQQWTDEMAFRQMVPPIAYGKKFGFLKEHYLRPIRDGIAHALLRNGEVREFADQWNQSRK